LREAASPHRRLARVRPLRILRAEPGSAGDGRREARVQIAVSNDNPNIPAASSALEEARIQAGLALPIALAQFGMIALSLVDTAFVGRVSRVDLAGVALGRSLSFALSSLAFGAASAVDPLAAQAIGAGRPDRAWSALTHAVRAILLLTVPTLLVTVAVTWVLPLAGVSDAVVHRTRAFLVVQMPSQAAITLFFAGKAFLQAHGVTRPALVGAVVANVVNVIACAALVRGDDSLRAFGLPPLGLPRLGAVGAAIASDLASMVMMGVVLAAAGPLRGGRAREPAGVAAGTSGTPESRGLASAGEASLGTGAVLRLGIPIGLQYAAEIGVFSIAALLAGRLGDVALSAHQIALGLASFTFMGALGVSGATAVRVGHAIGAGRSPRRPGFVGIALGLAAMVAGAVAFACVPGILVRLFTTDPAVVAMSIPLLQVAAAFQVFDGVQVVSAGALRGAGDVRLPFLANVVSHWLVGFPIALVLAFVFGLGALGLWLGLTVGLVTVAVTLAARFAVVSRRPVAAL
jgi:MATE family multidrug resistance protein